MPIVIIKNTIVTKEFLRVFAVWVDAKTQKRTAEMRLEGPRKS